MVIAPFVLSLSISLILIPLVRKVSFKVGRVAIPRTDRWHRSPTPALGGVGVFLAFSLGILMMILVSPTTPSLAMRWSILLGSGLMFLLGLIDDFKRLSPPMKLSGQILAATLVIFFGRNTINFFPWPIANIILTFFWLVGITNAINLLDNMDGLAGGVALIASAILSYFFWGGQNMDLWLLVTCLAGGILGFLFFNFPPAKIFMGDSGSLFLGFTLASLSIARRTQASNVFAVVMVPTLLFLLPILDTALVTVTRILRGQSPAQGGTDHTSHRLIAFGLSERQAVFVLYGVALISGVAAVALENLDYDLSLVLIPILLIVLSLLTAYLGRLKVVNAPRVNQGNISRILSELTYRQRVFEIALDLMIIGVSYYLAYWTRYGLNMTQFSMELFLNSWPAAFGFAYLGFYLRGVYRGVWQYLGLGDVFRYAQAALLAAVFTGLTTWLVYPDRGYTLDIFILYGFFLFMGLIVSRSSFQILDRLYEHQRVVPDQVGVLLYGADDAGELLLNWLDRNPQIGYRPIGFLDEDPYKWGRSIHGLDVIGDVTKISNLLGEQRIQGIIISDVAQLSIGERNRLIAVCRAYDVWVRVLRFDFEKLS
jgi:UDP-GlcNAc:undecaprenyl-phosphate GlcNAc-1-phosphate transferase